MLDVKVHWNPILVPTFFLSNQVGLDNLHMVLSCSKIFITYGKRRAIPSLQKKQDSWPRIVRVMM